MTFTIDELKDIIRFLELAGSESCGGDVHRAYELVTRFESQLKLQEAVAEMEFIRSTGWSVELRVDEYVNNEPGDDTCPEGLTR